MTPVSTPVAVVTGRDPVLDRLREMAAAPGTERCRLREAFIDDQRKVFRFLAHRLCRVLGLAAALHRDDVERLVTIEAVAWVDELLRMPGAIEGIENFEGMLHVRCRAAVSAWADRHLSPASGMVSMHRRVSQLNQLRDEMRSISAPKPTDREPAREHHLRRTAVRKDAARQGMLVTSADRCVTAPPVDVHALELTAGRPEESLLHPTEGPSLVRAVIEWTRIIGGVTADVAEAWLSGVDSAEGARRVLTTREVAEKLCLPQESAAAQIRKVRTLAQRIIAARLGIPNA